MMVQPRRTGPSYWSQFLLFWYCLVTQLQHKHSKIKLPDGAIRDEMNRARQATASEKDAYGPALAYVLISFTIVRDHYQDFIKFHVKCYVMDDEMHARPSHLNWDLPRSLQLGISCLISVSFSCS